MEQMDVALKPVPSTERVKLAAFSICCKVTVAIVFVGGIAGLSFMILLGKFATGHILSVYKENLSA